MRAVLSQATVMCASSTRETWHCGTSYWCVPDDRMTFEAFPGELDKELNSSWHTIGNSCKMVEQWVVKFFVFESIGELQVIPEPVIRLDFQLCELNFKHLSYNVSQRPSCQRTLAKTSVGSGRSPWHVVTSITTSWGDTGGWRGVQMARDRSRLLRGFQILTVFQIRGKYFHIFTTDVALRKHNSWRSALYIKMVIT